MGAIRLFLACVVAIDHFNNMVLRPAGLVFPDSYKLGFNAGYAVLFFYTISGFLISFVLDQKYGPNTGGFYRSRFIRIFSVYWPVALFSVAIFGPKPGTILDMVWGSILIGVDWRIAFADFPNTYWNPLPSFLHPAWTLGAELTFYALAPFILRSRMTTLILLAASGTIRAAMVAKYGLHEIWTYMFLPSTFLFFLLGNVAYRLRSYLANRQTGVVLLMLSLLAMDSVIGGSFDKPSFWLSVVCFAGSLPGIFEATKNIGWMNALGELSYPLYLTHLMIIWVILQYEKYVLALGLAEAMLVLLSGCICAAAIVHLTVEKLATRLMLLVRLPRRSIA